MECTYLACDHQGQSLLVNQFVVEGEGKLNADEIHAASLKCVEANPGIKIKLSSYWGFRHWSSDGPTPIVRDLSADWNGLSCDGAEFNLSPIDCRTGPVFELWLQEQKNHSRLVIRTHHATCDGLSTLHIVQELFKSLQGQALSTSVTGLSEWEVFQQTESKALTLEPNDWNPVPPPSLSPEVSGCYWKAFRFEGKTTKILAKMIKVLSDIGFQNHKEGHLLFRVPSNLRRLTEKSEKFQFSNLTGAIDIEVKAEHSVDDIYKKIIRGLRQNADLALFPKNFGIANWLPKSMFRANKKQIASVHERGLCNISGIVSFVGNIKHQEFSTEGFTATNVYAIPIPFDGVSISCGLFVDDKGLSCCVSIPKALTNAKECEDTIADIKLRLEAL